MNKFESKSHLSSIWCMREDKRGGLEWIRGPCLTHWDGVENNRPCLRWLDRLQLKQTKLHFHFIPFVWTHIYHMSVKSINSHFIANCTSLVVIQRNYIQKGDVTKLHGILWRVEHHKLLWGEGRHEEWPCTKVPLWSCKNKAAATFSPLKSPPFLLRLTIKRSLPKKCPTPE